MNTDDILLTPTRKRELEEELHALRTSRRQEITEAIKKAKEYGDLSENFEYQAARRDQAINNGRIAELEAVLSKAKVVEEGVGFEKIALGTLVSLKDIEFDETLEYWIVDAVSADPVNDKISYASPIGKALLDHKVGDIVEVTTPGGKDRYEVLEIRRA